jgi:hypothetical protein
VAVLLGGSAVVVPVVPFVITVLRLNHLVLLLVAIMSREAFFGGGMEGSFLGGIDCNFTECRMIC